MVQELTANILKHAQATEITIQVNKDRNNLNIIIEDNGIGFDTGRIKEAKGFGLGHIKQQASQLNGQMTIDSTPGNGTTIIVDIKV